MTNRLARGFLGLALLSLLSGCAVGQKVRYHDADLELDAAGNSPVAVASLDNRPYVKNGEKDKDYAGNLRGGFGNPFNLTTESGKPLADDMASVICAAFKKKGHSCTTVSLEPKEQKAQIVDKLKATNAKKLLLLTINEWLSSTYQNTSLTYDLDLTVMNESGASLAAKNAKGEDELGGSFWSPPAHAKEAVPLAYQKKLESMLNDPAVSKVLK
jgi:hypothetical protein